MLDHELSPKSVARDLSERAMTFVEYVGYYGLARSEGLVLRYLADAYKALRQTVPDEARTEEVDDLTEWLGELVRQVDSSLLDEWEQLRARRRTGRPRRQPVEQRPRPVTGNARAFRVLVRNAMFRRVELVALRRPDLLGELDPDVDWVAALEAYSEDHQSRRHRTGRARPGAVPGARRSPAAGRCARCSTTRRATTTGRSRPRSTSPPPTRRARPWCAARAWSGSTAPPSRGG